MPQERDVILIFRDSHPLRVWTRAREGAVAVEFALVALPLFMVILGLLEVTMMYISAVVLEGGTLAASRFIRTGQAQMAADPQVYFSEKLCAKVEEIIPCGSLQYEVIHPAGNSFTSADNLDPQYNANGDLISSGFDAGGVSDVVVIRAAYRYHFFTPFLGSMLSSNADNSKTLVSTVTLRSEPYDFEG